MNPDLIDPQTKVLSAFSATEAGLANLREQYADKVYDVATKEGNGEARHARLVLKDTRINVDKLRVQLKAPLLEEGRIIDAEAKRITAAVAALEDPIDAQIKAEEVRVAEQRAAEALAEVERVAKIDAIVRWLRERPGLYAAANQATLREMRAEIKAKAAAGFDSYGTGHVAIDAQVQVTLLQLDDMLTARVTADDEAARLRLAQIELAAAQRAIDEQREAMAAEQATLDAARAVQQAKEDDALLALLTPEPPATVAAAEEVMVEETNKAFSEAARALIQTVPLQRNTGEVIKFASITRGQRIDELIGASLEAYKLLLNLMPHHTTTTKLCNALSNLED